MDTQKFYQSEQSYKKILASEVKPDMELYRWQSTIRKTYPTVTGVKFCKKVVKVTWVINGVTGLGQYKLDEKIMILDKEGK